MSSSAGSMGSSTVGASAESFRLVAIVSLAASRNDLKLKLYFEVEQESLQSVLVHVKHQDSTENPFSIQTTDHIFSQQTTYEDDAPRLSNKGNLGGWCWNE